MAGNLPEEGVRWPIAQQTWRQVSMLHWRIDPGELQPLLPSRLQPDILDESAWVSIVAFRVAHFRLFGLPRSSETMLLLSNREVLDDLGCRPRLERFQQAAFLKMGKLLKQRGIAHDHFQNAASHVSKLSGRRDDRSRCLGPG